MLLDLANGVKKWAELETNIGSLPSEQERGAAFEEFCVCYFALSDLFQFKEVYSQGEFPPSLCKRLGYPAKQDIGIDGLGVTHDNKLYAWQAKFRRDRTKTPTKRELATFYTFSDKADWRITITNANQIPKELNVRTRQSRVLSDKLDGLDPEFFDQLRSYLQSKTVKPPHPIIPHQTQQEAIDAAENYFRTEDRGQLILPCGTGKTLAALWIAERLGGNRFLVMVPSLSLMDQTLREWAKRSSLRPFRYQCLCSDTTVDLRNDAPIEHLYDMEVPVTTDMDSVSEFLSTEPNIPSVLFSTYQSGAVLAEATKLSGVKFDVGVFDEAHRTTGVEGLWGLATNDTNVPISKRLFMTATPRIYAPHVTKKAQDNDVLLCSMDDVSIYGKPFYEMNFGDAIERGHITDYRIVVVCVTDKEVKNLITQGGRVIADEQEWDAKAFAKRVALVKAIQKYGLRKIFTFHGKVKSADAFTNPKSPYSISQVVKTLSSSEQQKVPKCFHVHGGMSSGVRKGYLDEFKRAEISVMSNARCLTEGVDVPAVDAVAFIDPKRSLIDIVQATGRALRVPPKGSGYTKDKGYIFIPVFVEEETDVQGFIQASDFDSVWKVIQAMKDQDQRLEDVISQLRVMQGKSETGSKAWNVAMAEYGEKISFFDLPRNFEHERFVQTIYAKLLEVVGQSWDFWYGLLLEFVENKNHAQVPGLYVTKNGHKLGFWLSNQRQRKERLTGEQIERLEILPGWSWDPFTDMWEEGFSYLLEFVKVKGHAWVHPEYISPDGFKLGGWARTQRQNKENIPQDRSERLDPLPGWSWDPFTDMWEEGFAHLVFFVEVERHAEVPELYITRDGYRLGRWVKRQRHNKENIPQDRCERLDSLLGWTWDPNADKWEKGYVHLLSFVKEKGHAWVSPTYKSPDGYRLGGWVIKQRTNKKNMTPECCERLEALLGWVWDARCAKWEEGYVHLLEFAKVESHVLVHATYKSPDGFKLGGWVNRQRGNEKNISQDRRERLEALLGWVWDARCAKWEEGYVHLLEFVKENGHAWVHPEHESPDGFKLGGWVNRQRGNEKNISQDRRERLEALAGWVWSAGEAKWEEGYVHLLEFVKERGDANVPQSFKSLDGFRLGAWVSNNRSRKAGLSEERQKRLETLLGWVWSVKGGKSC